MSEESELKYYSLDEIKNHDGKNNNRVWIVYKDGVYDVTDFLKEHPGGDDLIKEYAGKDATRAFNDHGHSSDAKKTLKKFKIGEVNENERKENHNMNIKKSGTVKTSPAEKPQNRSCISVFTCGLCG